MKLEAVLESDSAIYLVCEKLNGGNILERINITKGFTLCEVRQIMRGILSGLEYLHKFDIAHRDIKLDNIVFRDEKSLDPVIADFGLATFTDDEPYIFNRCGTPGFLAPEITRMRENRRVRVSCDIFSAGVVFHILLTNKYLFEGINTK
jgi:calcium-dependent protein kinase